MKKVIIIAAILLLVAVVISGSMFTVREDQYACTFRFSEIVETTETKSWILIGKIVELED